MRLKTLVGRALIAGLCVAAAAAIVALLNGDFGDTAWRVILTSLGFSTFTALGASGDALRQRTGGWRAAVGIVTTAAAGFAFVLLLVATWSADDFDVVWRAFGVCGLIALCGSHASLVLRAQRPEDPPLVTTLVWTSIVTATFSTLVGDIAIVGLVDDIDEDVVRFVAAVLVVALLSTALPPILRRVGHAVPAPEARGSVADEIIAAAGRVEAVETPGEARREASALRDLAARARG